MKSMLAGLLVLVALPVMALERPNILFIAIDDLNDWVGPLKGHPQVQTPHLDRLAARGTLFSNAHCQAPLCNPSRTSLLMGLRPSTTGIYGLAPWFRKVEPYQDHVTLPQYLARHGYRTYTAGKIFHGGYPPREDRPREMDVWGPDGGIGARPPEKLIPPTPMGNHPLMDWGLFPHRDEDKGDWQVATWAVERLKTMPKEQPFFLAAGFFLPHVPCFATEEWFDLYPEEELFLPPIKVDERDGTSPFSWFLHWRLPEPRLKWVREAGEWRNLVRSYLACISFIDHQVGRLLDALESEGFAENTVIVLWSDHGYHLGEKLITGKNTLWERSTRVPLIFAGPGISQDADCERPVELLDIFPTLIELCNLPARRELEGRSLVPLLQDADAPRPWPAITTHNQGNHAVRSEHWRYIRYADGSEELYDVRRDPHEWNNLEGNIEHAAVLAEHRKWLPKTDRPPAPGSAHRVLTFNVETGTAVWEGETIRPGDPIPE
jgi:choline-sulfatase